tara:strand:+ start:501 stop:1085 length:585 start_codon:yes stop_codon:yes gene_type:complete
MPKLTKTQKKNAVKRLKNKKNKEKERKLKLVKEAISSIVGDGIVMDKLPFEPTEHFFIPILKNETFPTHPFLDGFGVATTIKQMTECEEGMKIFLADLPSEDCCKVESFKMKGKSYIGMKQLKKKTPQDVLDEMKANILKYNEDELNALHEANNKQFRNWCDDVVLYLITREIIYKTPIRVMDLPTDFPPPPVN